MATVTYQKKGKDQQLDVGEQAVTIGRQLGNILQIEDSKISRFHAVIEYRRGILGVRDLGSRNGTLVNDEPINAKGKRLKTGDVVTVGNTRLTVAKADPPKTNGKPLEEAEVSRNGASAEDTSKKLAKLVSELPDRKVKPADLVLLNTRGKVAFKRQKDDEGDGPPAEALTLLRLTLLVCFRTGASDVHLEPTADGWVLRVRVDGQMTELAHLAKPTGTKLSALIKVLGDIDISKSKEVQEGSFACRVPDRRVDYRLSFTPGLYGQKLVIRVLDAANAPQYLWDLGLGDDEFELLDRTTRRSEGMLLVCGPTGSGKSSTLYSVLRSIDSKERNVVTIEDPVEIRLDGITQQPVNEAQGNTFAALLRSVLRQDPDVVLVGEIRDNETAVAASQAAMTGHLVLSTVHSRDSVGAVFRLIDLGCEPFQIASGLSAVVAQRLVRRLCPHCRTARAMTNGEKAMVEDVGLETNNAKLYDAKGCAKCLGTGFLGRKAVFEVLRVTEKVRDGILSGANASELYATLRGTGYRRLREVALELALAGETTFDEADKLGT
ncbi:MAG: ATPase, T2SS/T4P/T4SS family [Planctomycetota bacterium]